MIVITLIADYWQIYQGDFSKKNYSVNETLPAIPDSFKTKRYI